MNSEEMVNKGLLKAAKARARLNGGAYDVKVVKIKNLTRKPPHEYEGYLYVTFNFKIRKKIGDFSDTVAVWYSFKQ